MLGWEETGSRMAKREKEEMSPSLSQRIASEPRSWWPWAGLWRKGKDWAPGSGKVQGCSPFHRQVGPGWNEMSFCFQRLPTSGKRDGLYRESCLVRSFWRGQHLPKDLGDAPWWDLRRGWQVRQGNLWRQREFSSTFPTHPSACPN